MDDFEVDEQDIAAQLGFASFGGQPKSKKRKVDLVSVDTTDTTTTANNTSELKPHVPQGQAPKQVEVRPSKNTDSNSQAFRSGIPNEHGDLAYFKPSFIEDPWANLMKNRQGSS